MLQQTTVAAVIPYFDRFLERFPSVGALAVAREAEVLSLWGGLGYYRRARNLWKGARVVNRAGALPRTVEGWREIPGVGPYTAGAIVSLGLNEAVPLVDGNVERVLSRLFRVRDLSSGRKEIWDLASRAVAEAAADGILPRNFNQALMELGASLCSPLGRPVEPLCGLCPLAHECAALRAGQVKKYPAPKRRLAFVNVKDLRVAYVDPSGRVGVRLQTSGWLKGLWDLPQIHAPPRRIWARFTVRHTVTHHKITREVLVVRGGVKSGLKYIDPTREDLPLGSAFRKSVRKMLGLL